MARGCLCCLKYMMFLFNLIFWDPPVGENGLTGLAEGGSVFSCQEVVESGGHLARPALSI
ncbi:tetraspanin 9 [Homo sapiens]|uniref:Tetraspanin 9 n=1 Tax=Homo sapiens TaxID=9606 RepID=E9PHL0_HUMAN|nr:tetraspanin 9 [Homo sapiens]KAI4064092.1 tetraspanin 9 [Homo sapiens]